MQRGCDILSIVEIVVCVNGLGRKGKFRQLVMGSVALSALWAIVARLSCRHIKEIIES